jgi:LPXTG-motif cell wall-anchored protein
MAYTLGAAKASASTVRPDIKLGSKGKYVTEAQELLRIATGLGDLLKVTGVFDEDTKGATQQFQSLNKLKVDGIIGPKTWSALLGKAVKRPAAASPAKPAQTKTTTPPVPPVPEPQLSVPPSSSPFPLIAGAAVVGLALLFLMRKK